MVDIDHNEINTLFEIEILNNLYNSRVVEKPFYDPNKKITSTKL